MTALDRAEIGDTNPQSDRNRDFYSTAPIEHIADRHELLPGERRFTEEYPIDWARSRVIDLGVGGGRTTPHLSAIANDYVGIDYSPQLVEHARALFGRLPNTRIEHGDARHLDDLDVGQFDVVIFSFNGIDYVSHAERQRILRQIASVLRPGGWVFFSSHSLLGASTWWPSPTLSAREPLSSLKRLIAAVVRFPAMVWKNRKVSLSKARKAGWAIINDGAFGLGVETYYVSAPEQVRQLDSEGFDLVEVLGHDGAPIDPHASEDRGWLSYVARVR